MILSLLFFTFLINYSSSCGAYTHQLISNRAMQYFKPQNSEMTDILKNNTNSVYPGSSFPDWFYHCDDLSDTAEDIHWPPFYDAAISYIREKYP